VAVLVITIVPIDGGYLFVPHVTAHHKTFEKSRIYLFSTLWKEQFCIIMLEVHSGELCAGHHPATIAEMYP
jgi:hypothetical protein